MPRSMWNGEVRIAQLRVPIKLFPAVKTKKVSFRQVHRADRVPVEYRLFCKAEGREVSRNEIVKGYEVAAGEFVVVPEEELKEATGPNDKRIDIEHFVDLDEVDPVLFERSYLLGAQEGGFDGYRTLRQALEQTGKAGLGRIRFHNRERLVALRALGDVVVLQMLHGAEEVVPRSSIQLAETETPTQQELEMARQLVGAMVEPFEIERWPDRYRERVLEMIEEKASGAEAPKPEPQAEPTSDLLDALKASMEAVETSGSRPARRRGGSRRTGKRERARR